MNPGAAGDGAKRPPGFDALGVEVSLQGTNQLPSVVAELIDDSADDGRRPDSSHNQLKG